MVIHSTRSHSGASHLKGDGNGADSAQPRLGQHAQETQAFGTVIHLPLGLDEKVTLASTTVLNQILVDTMVLRDLYKKHHWQVAGPTFYQLHLLFDKHFGEQSELVDELAERVQQLGGVTVAMAHDVAERTKIERAPIGREPAAAQISPVGSPRNHSQAGPQRGRRGFQSGR